MYNLILQSHYELYPVFFRLRGITVLSRFHPWTLWVESRVQHVPFQRIKCLAYRSNRLFYRRTRKPDRGNRRKGSPLYLEAAWSPLDGCRLPTHSIPDGFVWVSDMPLHPFHSAAHDGNLPDAYPAPSLLLLQIVLRKYSREEERHETRHPNWCQASCERVPHRSVPPCRIPLCPFHSYDTDTHHSRPTSVQ